jgi:hypothetical protein
MFGFWSLDLLLCLAPLLLLADELASISEA